MWGQGSVKSYDQVKERIIPTRVGTRKAITPKSLARLDHPHACGDKALQIFFKLAVNGSSPRVWGQGGAFLDSYIKDRIIPTRVGTRETKGFYGYRSRDHPHACGDKAST